jgi:hypothetical protein
MNMVLRKTSFSAKKNTPVKFTGVFFNTYSFTANAYTVAAATIFMTFALSSFASGRVGYLPSSSLSNATSPLSAAE